MQASLFASAAVADGVVGVHVSNRLTQPLEVLLDEVAGGWEPLVSQWRNSLAGEGLLRHVRQRQQKGAVIYPNQPFKALNLTPLGAVRLVILGQDPYHGPGQAEGLAFSVPVGHKLPPSLRNVFAELRRDLGVAPPAHGHLGAWARHGVLLLNTSLTVEEGAPASHANKGWEALTDGVIAEVAALPRPVIFLLWGAHAQAKRALIERVAPGRHQVLVANHPSPLSARRPPMPFIGCGHFGRVRELMGLDWMGSSIA